TQCKTIQYSDDGRLAYVGVSVRRSCVRNVYKWLRESLVSGDVTGTRAECSRISARRHSSSHTPVAARALRGDRRCPAVPGDEILMSRHIFDRPLDAGTHARQLLAHRTIVKIHEEGRIGLRHYALIAQYRQPGAWAESLTGIDRETTAPAKHFNLESERIRNGHVLAVAPELRVFTFRRFVVQNDEIAD